MSGFRRVNEKPIPKGEITSFARCLAGLCEGLRHWIVGRHLYVVFQGRLAGSEEISPRFLTDFKRNSLLRGQQGSREAITDLPAGQLRA